MINCAKKEVYKKGKIATIIIGIVLFIPNCTFDLFDNMDVVIPDLEILNVETVNNEVYITGEIIEEGSSEIELIGVCYNKEGNPSILENQILFEGTKGVFTINIGELEESTDYYLKIFAVNGQTYGESEVCSYNTGRLVPTEVPCELDNNAIFFDYSYFNLSYIKTDGYSSIGSFRVYTECISEQSSSAGVFKFSFFEEPVTGLYTTCKNNDYKTNEKSVHINIKYGMLNFEINPDSNVYVENANGNIEISFCNITYSTWIGETELYGNINTLDNK